jgi:RNA ligase (TIGR02306 family)
MSTFEAKIYELRIEPHPNADKLELAVVGDYRAIVGKGQFQTGDLGVYIQEGSIVPEWMLIQMNLVGKLAGKAHNRVKAIKLRGILSQGLVYPLRERMYEHTLEFTGEACEFNPQGLHEIVVTEGQDVAGMLGITKYEPPIPVHMAGEVFNAHGYTLSFDIENIKKFPNVLQDGTEMVIITEKLHGTWTCFGWHPDVEVPVVTSKGLSGQGLAFKHNEANKDNLYLRSFHATTSAERARDWVRAAFKNDQLPVYILGETFGKGVQDLQYGLDKPSFRAFDIYAGSPGKGTYLSGFEFLTCCQESGIETVPVLYTGVYTSKTVADLTDGKDNITGTHIREGVVIRPYLQERRNDEIGRVILKSVSEAYLLRGGETTELT